MLVTEKLFRAEDIAPFLGLHVNTIYRLASEKKITSIKVGRSVRFDLAQVIQDLKNGNGNGKHAKAARAS